MDRSCGKNGKLKTVREIRSPQSGRKGDEEDREWVKGHLERVGGEWRTTAKDRRSWRLLIENVVKEK